MGRPSRHKVYTEHYQKEAVEYRNYLLILGYAEQTCQSRYLSLKSFFSWLESIGIYQIQQITAVEISNFYEEVQNRKSTRTGETLKQKSVYDIMRCVQMYLGYVLDLGKIKTNPASHLKFTYPEDEVKRRIFSQEEIQQLYEATETQQEKAILHIAYGCGLRVNEISRLNKSDLRLSENMVIVQRGKNNKRRLVPITDKVSEDLQFFLSSEESSQRNDNAVFRHSKGGRMQEWTLNKLLKKIILRTRFGKQLSTEEINKVGIHNLRHSIATHLLENGMKLEQVRQFLGHSYIESTEIYTHISQEQINKMER